LFSFKGIIANLLFLLFNLGVFYTIYWAYKKDNEIAKEEEEEKNKSQHHDRN